ncbi:MAG: MopE-related protein [Polyangiales bacterium]
MTSTITGSNSCGYTPNSRMNSAACVVRNIADSVGDAIFGLSTFALNCSASGCHYSAPAGTYMSRAGCGTQNCNLTVSGYPNPFYGCWDAGPIQVGIRESNAWELRTWGDGSWTSCANPSGLSAPSLGGNELSNVYNTACDGAAVAWTPLAGSLYGTWRYLTNQNATNPSPYRNFNGTGAADPYRACRPVNVILLTDGDETCVDAIGGVTSEPAARNARNITCLRVDMNGDGDTLDPGEFNQDLNADGDCSDANEQTSFKTRVYAIGFGVTAGDTDIENIARSGGSPRNSAGRYGYYASNEAEISTAINNIIRDSQLVELCNGLDDDCDGLIDEDFNLGAACTVSTMACSNSGVFVCDTADRTRAICNATAPVPGVETTQAQCTDGRDNDCDGATDCADPACATQTFCTACTPTAEVCDGRDNDCDGQIDEGGITRPCGSMIGVCSVGTETCQPQAAPQMAGTWGACTGNTGGAEVCDGQDNNCNGVSDEGLTQPCGVNRGQCRQGVQLCLGAGGFGGACIGEVTASAEVCDGIDNDCDGMTDEGIASPGSCGVAGVGICTGGTIQCMGGMFQCVGGTMARPETCNGLDDDCNGVVDDGLPAGATCQPMGMMIPVDAMGRAIGACRLGTQLCRAGATVCDGAIGPAMEICNGIDDDCDGMVDEGLDGSACGVTMGACRAGTRRCVMGRQVCDGEVGPSAEVCDGIDNDCDGETDEGNPGGGGACGMMAGSCSAGVNVCRGGRIVCDGATGSMPEVCDGLDNDCNGMIDDGIPEGGACGSSMGRCMPGVQRCVMGRMVCEGGVGPRAEECNCIDDDCDGMTDETGEGGTALCGGGSVCAGAPSCGCLRPCGSGEFPCPAGRTCQDVGGQRLCVGDPCAGVNCPAGQVCSNGACRGLCDGVTCEAPLVCNPMTGRCVSNDCRTLNNCASNELCIGGRCVMDRCAGVNCPAGQACYDGTCAPSCAGVMCPSGQMCERGVCVGGSTTPCATVTCDANRVCNPATGMCQVSRCGTTNNCARGQTCDPLTGSCVDDSCATVRCPTGQQCTAGQCRMVMTPPVMTTPADRVISSGGGCSVPARGGSSNGMWVVGLALAAIAARRSRRSAEVSR